jgi:formylglycine-generating enzyme required for sulfatase activity
MKRLTHYLACLVLAQGLVACIKHGTVNQPVKAGEDFSVDLDGGVKLEMVWIRGGTLEVGRYGNEPVHLDGYWMGKYEVTQVQYEAIMAANPSGFKGASNPVENVMLDDATQICQKLSAETGQAFTLPPIEQWAYACRAGSTGRFWFGADKSQLGDFAWHKLNSGGRTHPVGGKRPNGWGPYDMYGNISEYLQDRGGQWMPEAVHGSWNTDPDEGFGGWVCPLILPSPELGFRVVRIQK